MEISKNRVWLGMAAGFLLLAALGAKPLYALGDRPVVYRMSPEREAEFLQIIREFEERSRDQKLVFKVLSPSFRKEVRKLELRLEQKKRHKKSYPFVFPSGPARFIPVQAGLPDFYLFFDFICRPQLSCTERLAVEPGGDAFKIYLDDYNDVTPVSERPRDIEIIGGYQTWSVRAESRGWENYTPFDYSTRFSSDPEERAVTQGARVIEVPLLPKTLELHDFTPFESGELPPVRRFEMSDGAQWDIYDLDLYLLLEIDPEDRIREGSSDAISECRPGGERNNRYIFRWFGMDRVGTDQEEIPPGFYLWGLVCPSGDAL